MIFKFLFNYIKAHSICQGPTKGKWGRPPLTHEENSKLVLTPQTNRDGSERKCIINPYQMVVANGRYYLVCNNDQYDDISHYGAYGDRPLLPF